MRQIFYFLVLLTGFSCSQTGAKAQTKTSPDDFEALLGADTSIQLVDVRTPEEYAEGHLKSAQLMNFYEDDFSTKLEKLDKEKPVLVYCRSGNRSGKAAALLQEMGFEKIYDLDGGIKAWESAGKETVQ